MCYLDGLSDHASSEGAGNLRLKTLRVFNPSIALRAIQVERLRRSDPATPPFIMLSLLVT